MTTSKPLRVGFIGAGGNTKLRHLPGFAAIEGVELAAVANRSVETAQAVAGEFEIAQVKADWREIVADPEIDAVCIGTWPNTHAEMTTAALAVGKSVLVEARMASTLAEARAMADAAAQQPHLVAQIVPAPFSLDADSLITEVIQSGQLGEIREIVSEFTSAATLDPMAPLSWRLDTRTSGINTMALGIAYEPLLRWIPGDAAVVAADAAVFTQSRTTASGEKTAVTIPESLTVLGRWSNGARLVMHQSSVESGPGRNHYRLVGSEGTLAFDVNGQSLTLVNRRGESEQLEFAKSANGGWRVEAQFVHSIRTGAPVELTDFETGVRYMKFTDAVWQAWNRK